MPNGKNPILTNEEFDAELKRRATQFSKDVARSVASIEGREPPEDDASFERFTVERDAALPLEFDGVVLGEAEEGDGGGPITVDTLVATRAAIYRTKGGKFVSEFARWTVRPVVSWGKRRPPKLFNKADVFPTLEAALGFFRPGRLTNALFSELGVRRTEFID